jgi:crotonobetainyl-CoA:carnitine CoA-transferase CaiB-like acyl-CoA transferase
MSGAEAGAAPYVAALGEHTEEVLAGIGCGPAEIASLSVTGASIPEK